MGFGMGAGMGITNGSPGGNGAAGATGACGGGGGTGVWADIAAWGSREGLLDVEQTRLLRRVPLTLAQGAHHRGA